MLTMQWFFGERDLADAHAVREAVFIDEQGISREEEHDGTDGVCVHVVIYDCDVPVATGRVMITPEDYVIGRVATLASHRGRGLATSVMQALIKACVIMGGQRQILHAQESARVFYEKLGFVAYGEPFMEAGIPHVMMEHLGGIDCACS